ncbi:MAG: hypothetical protein IRZ08_15895 [Frankia sp.]|nr:hypothetical protein [Frankia sp.]
MQLDSPDGAAENVILSFGHVVPPLLLRTLEEKRAAAEKIESVAVRSLARFSLSKARAKALIQLLNDVVGRFDELGVEDQS